MKPQHRTRLFVGIAAVATVVALAGCSTPTDTGPVDNGEGSYSPEEVFEASGGRVETPLFAVPKTHDAYTFAFLNPGLTIPTFVEWQNGIRAAAEFYGVTVDETDLGLDYSKAANAYQTLAVKGPTLVGTGAGAGQPGMVQAAATNDVAVLFIDQEPSEGEDVSWFGVDNAGVGEIGGEKLAEAATEITAGDWAGEEVVYLGVSAGGCAPCDDRVQTGGEIVQEALGLSDDQVLFLAPQDGSAAGEQAAATDFLTAHPDAKIVSLAYGDGGAVGVLNALAQADRLDDGLVVSLGGDPSGRAALRDTANATAFVGAVDFNPFAQGWNWVEAAIALELGEDFGEYAANRFLTAENVDEFYPDDRQ